MKNIIKLAGLTLLTAALVAMPVGLRAQDATTNAPAAAVAKKKGSTLQFHGKISAVDASGGNFTVGTLTLNVTSKSKITTNNVPATLADFKVGDNVAGAYKKTAEGKLNVTTLHLAGKAKKKAAASATESAAAANPQ